MVDVNDARLKIAIGDNSRVALAKLHEAEDGIIASQHRLIAGYEAHDMFAFSVEVSVAASIGMRIAVSAFSVQRDTA